jgi:hypothetical protein
MVYTDNKRLTADYLQELVEFGKAIGLGLWDLQNLNDLCKHTHFKLDKVQLAAALKRGAITVSLDLFMLRMYRMRRIGEREMFQEEELAEGKPVINTKNGQTELM